MFTFLLFCDILFKKGVKNVKRLGFKMSDELYDYLKKESEREGISMSALVVFCIKNYMNQQEFVKKVSDMDRIVENLSKLKHEEFREGG